MPIARVLLVASIALVVMVAVLWAFDVNYLAWLGAWLLPESQYAAGITVFVVLGLSLAYFYASVLGEKFGGPGVARGMAFGAVLGAFAIWGLPPILSGIAGAVGNAQMVYHGRGLTNDAPRADDSRHVTRVEPVPAIGGVAPPLAFMTANQPWAPADAWKGRVLPLGVAFLVWGAIVGAFLSEEKKQ